MRRDYYIFTQQPTPIPNLLMDIDFAGGMEFDGVINENIHSNLFFGPSSFMKGDNGLTNGFFYSDDSLIPTTDEMQKINGNNINGVRITSECKTQFQGFNGNDGEKWGNRGLISASQCQDGIFPTYFTPIKGTMDFSICIGFKTPSMFKDYYYNSGDRCFNLIGQTNVKTWTKSNSPVEFNSTEEPEIINYNTQEKDSTPSSNSGRWLLGINYDTTNGENMNQLKFWFNNLNGISSNYYVNTIVQPNTYYHVTLIRKNNVFRIYVNGNEVGITRTAGGTNYTIGGLTGYNENIANSQELMPLFIGTYHKCGYFCATDFVFTDAKIYDGALTLEQIQTESSPYYVH